MVSSFVEPEFSRKRFIKERSEHTEKPRGFDIGYIYLKK